MKKKICIIILMIILICFLYETTSIYLQDNTSSSLVNKLNKNQYEEIDFYKVFNLIRDNKNYNYDKFLLEILKKKEVLDKPPCKKCIGTIQVISNSILNEKYKREFPYLSYYNIYNQLARPNDKYNYLINNVYREKLISLTKEVNHSNEKAILSIINEINENTIKNWEKIIKY